MSQKRKRDDNDAASLEPMSDDDDDVSSEEEESKDIKSESPPLKKAKTTQEIQCSCEHGQGLFDKIKWIQITHSLGALCDTNEKPDSKDQIYLCTDNSVWCITDKGPWGTNIFNGFCRMTPEATDRIERDFGIWQPADPNCPSGCTCWIRTIFDTEQLCFLHGCNEKYKALATQKLQTSGAQCLFPVLQSLICSYLFSPEFSLDFTVLRNVKLDGLPKAPKGFAFSTNIHLVSHCPDSDSRRELRKHIAELYPEYKDSLQFIIQGRLSPDIVKTKLPNPFARWRLERMEKDELLDFVAVDDTDDDEKTETDDDDL